MKKIMSSILSLSMALLAIAAPMSANANEGRAIVGPVDGWDNAIVSQWNWSVPSANRQVTSFTVKSKYTTTSYTRLEIKLTNAKLVDKYSKVVCDKTGTAGTCPLIETPGVNNKFTVTAGTNGYGASYQVISAKTR